jgi:hypothetical protein
MEDVEECNEGGAQAVLIIAETPDDAVGKSPQTKPRIWLARGGFIDQTYGRGFEYEALTALQRRQENKAKTVKIPDFTA